MNESLFYKVSDVGMWGFGIIKYETLIEFINCLNTPVMGRYIRNLSNMYVLLGQYNSNEHKWDEILNLDEFIFIEGNGEIILAFILLDSTKGPYHTIEYIWTRESVRKQGIARRIICKYEELFNDVKIIPSEVASGFWKRYFIEVFGINSLENLLEFKKNINIPTLRWDLLEARYKYTDNGDLSDYSDTDIEYKLLSID